MCKPHIQERGPAECAQRRLRPYTEHLCLDFWSKAHGEEGRATERCTKLKKKQRYSWWESPEPGRLGTETELEFVAGASLAKVNEVKDWMAEVEKTTRGVACTEEDEGYDNGLQAIWKEDMPYFDHDEYVTVRGMSVSSREQLKQLMGVAELTVAGRKQIIRENVWYNADFKRHVFGAPGET